MALDWLFLDRLFVYPVKSLRGMDVQAWPVTRMGLVFDRRWMVVTLDGQFLTQRRFPQMARIRARIALEDALQRRPRLVLEDAHGDILDVAEPTEENPRLMVTVWDDRVPAQAVDPRADAWLSERLGVPCRLVYFPDDVRRTVPSLSAHPDDTVAFADAFPLLVLTQASVRDLNQRLVRPVTVEHFRPNVVIEGASPYEEDGWEHILIGDVPVRVVKPCARCVITTVDPETGRRLGKEPLATLATYRRVGNRVYFGQNAVPEGEGLWRIGMPVFVEAP